MIRGFLAIGLLFSACTNKKESAEATNLQIQTTCEQQLTTEGCRALPQCVAHTGIDVVSKEDVFVSCSVGFTVCHGRVSCFANGTGQRVVRESSCAFKNWTEVTCTEEEKKIPSFNPCEVATPEACLASNKCSLRSARDVATRETVIIGCTREGEKCNQAISCYSNPVRRVIASSMCRTFPEWEYVPCQPEDSLAK